MGRKIFVRMFEYDGQYNGTVRKLSLQRHFSKWKIGVYGFPMRPAWLPWGWPAVKVNRAGDKICLAFLSWLLFYLIRCLRVSTFINFQVTSYPKPYLGADISLAFQCWDCSQIWPNAHPLCYFCQRYKTLYLRKTLQNCIFSVCFGMAISAFYRVLDEL